MLLDVDMKAERQGGYPYDGYLRCPPSLAVDSSLRVVVLDIDGVLNGPMGGPTTFRVVPDPRCVLDRLCIRRLNQITAATDAQIVVSSSWRKEFRHSLARILEHAGVEAPVLSMTPFLGWQRYFGETEHRGKEIRHWFRLFKRAHGFLPAHVVVLDDVPVTPLNSYAVYTRGHVGLEDHHVAKAIRMLGRPFRFHVEP